MTMTEKIFSRASEKSNLIPGENVWVNVDTLMTHDVCGPGAIGVFKKEFGNNAKVHLLIFTHFYLFLVIKLYINEFGYLRFGIVKRLSSYLTTIYSQVMKGQTEMLIS